MNIVFKVMTFDLGQRRGIAAETVLPCGCALRDAEYSPVDTPEADWPKSDGKAKLALIQRFQREAAAHDHRAHLLKQVTARLKQ